MNLLIISLLVLATAAASAGTIKGIVRAQGKDGTDAEAGDGKYESRKFKFAERVDYAAMRDFVVYIDEPPAEKAVPPAKPVQVVTQAGWRPRSRREAQKSHLSTFCVAGLR